MNIFEIIIAVVLVVAYAIAAGMFISIAAETKGGTIGLSVTAIVLGGALVCFLESLASLVSTILAIALVIGFLCCL